MQTLGHSRGLESQGTGATPLLQRAGWLEKLPLTLVCGALLGFSSAGYGVYWLAWVGLAPLFLLVYGSKTRMEAMLTGLLFGFAYHLVAMRWLLDLYPLNWLGVPAAAGMAVAGQAWLFECLHQSLLFALFAIFVYTLPMRAGFLPYISRPFFPMLVSVPLIWLFIQWIVAPSPFFLGVPIDQLAYSQARFPAAIQIASIGGAQLVEFLLVLFNCAFAALLIQFTGIAARPSSRADAMSDESGALFDFAFVAALAALSIWWGRQQVIADAAPPSYYRPVVQQNPASPGAPLGAAEKAAQDKARKAYSPAIPVAVLQNDVAADDLDKLTGPSMQQKCLPLVENTGASLIVLPAATLDQPRRGTEPLRLALNQLARAQKKDVIVGVREKSVEGIWEGVRVYSADKFNKDTDYVKYRLIPLAEYTPISFLTALIPNALKQRAGGEDHVKPQSLATIKSVFGRVGASVSAELVYPDLIVSQVTRGASLLVNVSDLACFHKPMLAQELLAAGAVRAVENGRYMVIASNGGVSAVIDNHGIVTSAGAPNQRGLLLDRVQFLTAKTPFTRMCLWTPLYH